MNDVTYETRIHYNGSKYEWFDWLKEYFTGHIYQKWKEKNIWKIGLQEKKKKILSTLFCHVIILYLFNFFFCSI